MNTNTEHINIFIAYSRKDEDHLGKLRTTLTPLERRYESVNIWFDGKIEPGKDWNKSIKKHLHEAHIILLMVSMDSLASEYFYNEEMQDALKRHELGEAIVIPIILRVCDWKEELIGSLQALPKDGVPVTKWGDKDDAYFDILRGIKQSVGTIQNRREIAQKAKQERILKEEVVVEKERQRREATHSTPGTISWKAENERYAADGGFATWNFVNIDMDNGIESLDADLVIDLASVSEKSEKLAEHLKQWDYFDVEKYTKATANISNIRANGDGYIADLTLKMRGAEQVIESAFEVVSTQPLRVKGTADVDRRIFKIGSDETGKYTGFDGAGDVITVSYDTEVKF